MVIECLVSPILFSLVMEVLARAVSQTKREKDKELHKKINKAVTIYKIYENVIANVKYFKESTNN